MRCIGDGRILSVLLFSEVFHGLRVGFFQIVHLVNSIEVLHIVHQTQLERKPFHANHSKNVIVSASPFVKVLRCALHSIPLLLRQLVMAAPHVKAAIGLPLHGDLAAADNNSFTGSGSGYVRVWMSRALSLERSGMVWAGSGLGVALEWSDSGRVWFWNGLVWAWLGLGTGGV